MTWVATFTPAVSFIGLFAGGLALLDGLVVVLLLLALSPTLRPSLLRFVAFVRAQVSQYVRPALLLLALVLLHALLIGLLLAVLLGALYLDGSAHVGLAHWAAPLLLAQTAYLGLLHCADRMHDTGRKAFFNVWQEFELNTARLR